MRRYLQRCTIWQFSTSNFSAKFFYSVSFVFVIRLVVLGNSVCLSIFPCHHPAISSVCNNDCVFCNQRNNCCGATLDFVFSNVFICLVKSLALVNKQRRNYLQQSIVWTEPFINQRLNVMANFVSCPVGCVRAVVAIKYCNQIKIIMTINDLG